MKKSITAIVKPTHDCNLACTYCYLEDCAEKGNMSFTTLSHVIHQVMENVEKSAHFIWHGGEPLLMGRAFYQKVYDLQQPYKSEKSISNSIQSNGTLVTQNFLEFIAEKKDFYLGFSLDGPKHISDQTRIYPNGNGAFDEIFAGVKMARDYGCNVGGGAIVVLNKKNLESLSEIIVF